MMLLQDCSIALDRIRRPNQFLWWCRVAQLLLLVVSTGTINAFHGGCNGGGRMRMRGVAIAAFRPPLAMVVAPSPSPRKNANALGHPNQERVSTSAMKLRATTTEMEVATGSRYLCLLEDYEKTKGPYFFALFDQLFELSGHGENEKHVAFLTTRKDLDGIGTNATSLAPLLESMESSLELDGPPEVFVLDDWNPLALEERFSLEANEEPSSLGEDGGTNETRNENDHQHQRPKPTILWLYGRHNAFHTRHLLRTSGFDRYLQEQCASSSRNTESQGQGQADNCIFVGEGTGAACAGITMNAARARGDDPKGAPELQAYGLKLLGNEGVHGDTATDGVVFAKTVNDDDDDSDLAADRYPEIEMCGKEEVFVWAQPPRASSSEEEEQVATKFVMAPNRRGTIERYVTLDPLPPLVVREQGEGVACYGEPSVDPSRSAQAGSIGDSEWWE